MTSYLVIQLARFGDILQTKRLIQGLASRPDVEVHLAVDAGLAELAGLVYPDICVHGLPVHGRQPNPAHALRLCRPIFRQWQQAGFEKVFNLNHSGFNTALASLFDPGQVAGYRWLDGQALKGNWPEMVFRLTRRRLTNPLNLMDYWAYFSTSAMPPELVNPPAQPRSGGLGVAMAGRHARRSLPVPVLAQVLTAAMHGRPGPVFLLGGKAEKSAARVLRGRLSPGLQGRVRDLTGCTGWKDLIEVVGQLDLLLTPDTGTMHLAAHLGVPVMAFFLSSAWCFETGPYGEGHVVWQATRRCAPCLEAETCDQEVACLEPFSHRTVLAAVSAQAASQAAHPPDICLLESRLDDFGLTFDILRGDLPEGAERLNARDLLRTHQLGLASTGGASMRDPAGMLYFETDWMLEQS